ncbi:MAG: hypothetical protein J7L15_04750 [Clostridiales bacterium]|nr:hypothetical protein [Clostridiales bacterium]
MKNFSEMLMDTQNEDISDISKLNTIKNKKLNAQLKFLKDDVKNNPTDVWGRLESIKILIQKWQDDIKAS